MYNVSDYAWCGCKFCGICVTHWLHEQTPNKKPFRGQGFGRLGCETMSTTRRKSTEDGNLNINLGEGLRSHGKWPFLYSAKTMHMRQFSGGNISPSCQICFCRISAWVRPRHTDHTPILTNKNITTHTSGEMNRHNVLISVKLAMHLSPIYIGIRRFHPQFLN
jgi:hypothetical protein